MIDAPPFVDVLERLGVKCFAGVPDSLLKPLCAEIDRRVGRGEHVITANEGAAVAVAMGHYLRTGNPALVYMQNSGIGNAVNPLMSLADPEVYGIPMVLVVGWRGAPGVKDEPQHVKQGRVMTAMLDALELPWTVLPAEQDAAAASIADAFAAARSSSGPFVVLVEKGTFRELEDAAQADVADALPTREEAVAALAEAIGPGHLHVATTGMLSRELFEFRRDHGGGERDFLTVGGMGHASSIALGLALSDDSSEVWCLDGDGALLMHLGTLAVVGDLAPRRLFHVVFNNGVHDSVGGQRTSIAAVDLDAMARAAGYRAAWTCSDLAEIPPLVARMRSAGGPSLAELRVRPGSRPDLGRPTRTPQESKARFMASVD